MPKRFTMEKNDQGTWRVVDPPLELPYLGRIMQGVPDETVRRATWAFLHEMPEFHDALEDYTLDELEDLRTQAFARIDDATAQVIARGFQFEDRTFSLSIEAQTRYLSLKLDADSFEYPIAINTLDDRDKLELRSSEHTRAFCDVARDHMLKTVNDGSELKKKVRKLSTEEELRAFKDPRT